MKIVPPSDYLVVEKKQLRDDLVAIVSGFLGTGMYGRLSQLLADYATDGLLAEQDARRAAKKGADESLTTELLARFVESCGVKSPPRDVLGEYVRSVKSVLRLGKSAMKGKKR